MLGPVGWQASMLLLHGGRCHAALRVPPLHKCNISTHSRPSNVIKRRVHRPCTGCGRDDPSDALVAPEDAEVESRCFSGPSGEEHAVQVLADLILAWWP